MHTRVHSSKIRLIFLTVTTRFKNLSNGQHVCQFHRDGKTLSASVGAYVDAGLADREGVVAIVVADRGTCLIEYLRARGIDVDGAMADGQLVLLDAHETLHCFMRDGSPDQKTFNATFIPVLRGFVKRGYTRVRAYGEMVSVLWNYGNPAAAIALEKLWNDLGQRYRFALYCGYQLDTLHPDTYSTPLDEVARSHSAVLVDEQDERLQQAVDEAATEVLGLPLSSALTYGNESMSGSERRLPSGLRTLLWLHHNTPTALHQVLARVRTRLA